MAVPPSRNRFAAVRLSKHRHSMPDDLALRFVCFTILPNRFHMDILCHRPPNPDKNEGIGGKLLGSVPQAQWACES
jgi:hypothetical protein